MYINNNSTMESPLFNNYALLLNHKKLHHLGLGHMSCHPYYLFKIGLAKDKKVRDSI